MSYTKFALAIAVASIFNASATFAHHSFAGFDMETTRNLSGTLVRFDFSAPHARLVMMSVGEGGVTEEYQFMTGSPTQLLQRGFDPRTVHKGDKIDVTYHPTRNGSLGGQLIKMVTGDGRELIDPSVNDAASERQRQPASTQP